MQVLWTTPKKFKLLSWAIQKYLKVPYSHTAVLYSIKGTNIVFHATKKGVHTVSYEKFIERNWITNTVVIAYCKGEKAREIERDSFKRAVKYLGTKYSTLSLITMALKIRFSDGESKMVCSEFIARILGAEGESIDYVDPKKLLEILDK